MEKSQVLKHMILSRSDGVNKRAMIDLCQYFQLRRNGSKVKWQCFLNQPELWLWRCLGIKNPRNRCKSSRHYRKGGLQTTPRSVRSSTNATIPTHLRAVASTSACNLMRYQSQKYCQLGLYIYCQPEQYHGRLQRDGINGTSFSQKRCMTVTALTP